MATISKYYKKDKNGNKVQKGWRSQVTTPEGKRISIYGKSSKELKEKIKVYYLDLELYGDTLASEEYTVSEWTEKHLFTNKVHETTEGTFAMYVSMFTNYIKYSKFGKMKINTVKQIDVQDLLNSHTDLAHSTINKIYLILLSSFESAKNNKLIRDNVVKGVIVPNKNKPTRDIRVMTIVEQGRYIKHAENELHALLYLTALFTGMRQGELVGLRWENVDLENKVIYVKESLKKYRVYTSNSEYTIETITKPPKSKAGVRSVPIPDFLVERLKDHTHDCEYVFHSSNNTPLLARNILNYHNRICERAGITGVTFHALRHTYVTRLIEAGESIKVIQNIIGHADVQTTLNIYGHILEDTRQASASKLNDLFNKLK